jgi:hypothetical protein
MENQSIQVIKAITRWKIPTKQQLQVIKAIIINHLQNN